MASTSWPRRSIEPARTSRERPSFTATCWASPFDDASFDAIVSFYAIEHLPREDHGRLFERSYRWLRPGGRLLLTLEAGGDEPGRTGEWLGVPMFFSYYDADATTTLLEQAGFVVERREVESQLEGGREIEYVWFHVRKAATREAETSD